MIRLSITAVSILAALALNASGAERPNIVLFIADDMTWSDCGAYGHPGIRTPNIDRLALEGVVFDNAYLTISSCSPSRASIITGLYPHQTGAEELHWPLPAEQVTFVEMLRDAGYWTGAAGKWHLGDAVRDRFDEIREVDTSGFQLPAGEAGKEGKFVESLEGEARSGAADWVPLLQARPKDQPFFLWLAALDPHRDYEEDIIPDPHTPEDARVAPYHVDNVETREDYAHYYDEIARLDRYVGLVMSELQDQGVAEETLVVFMSDNGRPFPRDKTTLYDSGIRTPFIVRWPGHANANTRCEEVVSSVDLAVTFLEVAGVKPAPGMEGVNFLPLLEDPDTPVREYAFAEKNWHDFEDHARMVADRRYKLIFNAYNDLPLTPSADSARSPSYESLKALREMGGLSEAQNAVFLQPRPRLELYDTWEDPWELTNLIEVETLRDVRQRLSRALDEWTLRTGDYVPVLRTADEFDRETGVPTDARVRPRRSRAEMVEMGLAAP